ncbi:hypothetical protein LXL04_006099 [Taraxacum kok-saghyz]
MISLIVMVGDLSYANQYLTTGAMVHPASRVLSRMPRFVKHIKGRQRMSRGVLLYQNVFSNHAGDEIGDRRCENVLFEQPLKTSHGHPASRRERMEAIVCNLPHVLYYSDLRYLKGSICYRLTDYLCQITSFLTI